jgi:hypothetical protein
MEIKPKLKHFEIKTINWVPDKKKVRNFNLIFSGKNRELENVMSRIINEEVSCNKIIPTFLPAEFIGSKIDLNTNSIYIPENAKNGLNSFVRFLAWIIEEGLIVVKDKNCVYVISKNKVKEEKRAITKVIDN